MHRIAQNCVLNGDVCSMNKWTNPTQSCDRNTNPKPKVGCDVYAMCAQINLHMHVASGTNIIRQYPAIAETLSNGARPWWTLQQHNGAQRTTAHHNRMKSTINTTTVLQPPSASSTSSKNIFTHIRCAPFAQRLRHRTFLYGGEFVIRWASIPVPGVSD